MAHYALATETWGIDPSGGGECRLLARYLPSAASLVNNSFVLDPGIPVRRLGRECTTASDELIWDGERRLSRRLPTSARRPAMSALPHCERQKPGGLKINSH
jgi:hypothetical protein